MLAATTLALALTSERDARAAPFDPEGQDWEGLSQIVRMAKADVGDDRVKIPRALDLGELKSTDAILLVHPTRTVDAPELADFMRAGGRVVLLDDYGSGETLLSHFGIRRVPLPKHPAEMLRGRAEFAIAEPVSGHAAVRDVARVVTNHGTGLADTGLLPLLAVHGQNEPDVLLSVAGIVGKGRFLAIGDASVIVNAMLRYPGNHALANALLRYATDEAEPAPASGMVSAGRLFFVTNDCVLRGRFDASRSSVKRAVLAAFDALRNGVPPVGSYLAAIATGFGIVLWTSSRAGRTHRARPPRFVRPISDVAQGGIAGHAAVLKARGTPRILAALELKSALEEYLTTRLDLDRGIPHHELVAKGRTVGLLDRDREQTLTRLLDTLTRLEARFVQKGAPALAAVRDRHVVAWARQTQDLLAAMSAIPLEGAGARHPSIASGGVVLE